LTGLVLVETRIVAVPVALPFGIEETLDWKERPFSQADTLADFVAQEVKLAGGKEFVAETESFPSLHHNFDRALAVGWEVDCTVSVAI